MHSLKVFEGGQSETYICAHWRVFPPMGAGQDAEHLRSTKTITEEQYNHLQVWQRDCGQLEMGAPKCLACPHRRRVAWRTQGPALVDPKGVEAPIVDSAAGEAAPRNRHFGGVFKRPGTRGSHQPVAWTPDGEDDAGSSSGV